MGGPRTGTWSGRRIRHRERPGVAQGTARPRHVAAGEVGQRGRAVEGGARDRTREHGKGARGAQRRARRVGAGLRGRGHHRRRRAGEQPDAAQAGSRPVAGALRDVHARAEGRGPRRREGAGGRGWSRCGRSSGSACSRARRAPAAEAATQASGWTDCRLRAAVFWPVRRHAGAGRQRRTAARTSGPGAGAIFLRHKIFRTDGLRPSWSIQRPDSLDGRRQKLPSGRQNDPTQLS